MAQRKKRNTLPKSPPKKGGTRPPLELRQRPKAKPAAKQATNRGNSSQKKRGRVLLSKKPTLKQEAQRRENAWYAYIAIHTVLGLLAALLWKDMQLGGGIWNTGGAIVAFQAGFAVFTLRTVDSAKERVFISYFGDAAYEVIRLYPIIPFVLDDRLRFRTRGKKAQFPRELEYVWRGEGIMPEDSGKEYPYLIVFPGRDGSKDVYEQKGTYGCTAYMIYVIIDIWQFIFEVGSLEELEDRVKDVFGNVMQNEASKKKTVLAILENWIQVNNTLQDALKDRVEGWGVEIQSAKFDPIDLGYHINKILKEYAASLRAADQLVVEKTAEAEGNRQIGYAKADVDLAELQKLAEGIEKLEDRNIKPEMALKLLTIQAGLENADYSILSGSGGNTILDLIANIGATPGGRNVLQSKPKPKVKPKPKAKPKPKGGTP